MMKKGYWKYNILQAFAISSTYTKIQYMYSSTILTGTKNTALEAVGRSVSTARPSTGTRSLPQGKPPVIKCAAVRESTG